MNWNLEDISLGKNVCFYIFRPSPIVVERDNVENGIMVKAQFSNQSNQSSEGRARAIRQAKHSAGQMDSRIIAGLLGNVAAAARGREAANPHHAITFQAATAFLDAPFHFEIRFQSLSRRSRCTVLIHIWFYCIRSGQSIM